jgi:beta-lactamase class A
LLQGCIMLVKHKHRAIALLLTLIVLLSGTLGITLTPVATLVGAGARSPMSQRESVMPHAEYAELAHHTYLVGSHFTQFYNNHYGVDWFGPALTPELPTSDGIVQIMRSGILLAAVDGSVTIEPVGQRLLSVRAHVPLAAVDASLTYADIAASVLAPVAAPWWWHSGGIPARDGMYLVPSGQRLGHYVPAVIAGFLTSIPDWQILAGAPLTEAISTTIRDHGVMRPVVIQCFDNVVLIENMAVIPHVQVQTVGIDMLDVFGPPSISLKGIKNVWAGDDATPVYLGPGATNAMATFSRGYPFIPSGDAIWLSGSLWYHVTWNAGTVAEDGWIPAERVRLAQPAGTNDLMADLGALSSQLGTYARAQGDSLSITVYATNSRRFYGSNPDLPLTMASTFKIPLLLALLSQSESQGRSLTDTERVLAQSMIEDSDNDAAQAIYADVGYDTGVAKFMATAGISGLWINTAYFGYSTMTSREMVLLLAALYNGQILNAEDRQFALDLMTHIDDSQRRGIGTAAPSGAKTMLKDGWLQDEDGWVSSSVGITVLNGQSYVVAIYLRRQATLDNAWQVIETLCQGVNAVLLSQQ